MCLWHHACAHALHAPCMHAQLAWAVHEGVMRCSAYMHTGSPHLDGSCAVDGVARAAAAAAGRLPHARLAVALACCGVAAGVHGPFWQRAAAEHIGGARRHLLLMLASTCTRLHGMQCGDAEGQHSLLVLCRCGAQPWVERLWLPIAPRCRMLPLTAACAPPLPRKLCCGGAAMDRADGLVPPALRCSAAMASLGSFSLVSKQVWWSATAR